MNIDHFLICKNMDLYLAYGTFNEAILAHTITLIEHSQIVRTYNIFYKIYLHMK
jgi:hypothetical protein